MKRLAITLGLVIGIVMVLMAGGFGVGLLVAMTYGSGFESGLLFMIVLLLLQSALIMTIGVFKLNRSGWVRFYSVYCFILGIASFIVFFIMWGAIGVYLEIAMLIMGILSICLGFIVKKLPVN